MSALSIPSPYKGLVPYDESDAPFFFGREAETEIISANLMASRLTLLYGASGVGKSSVLRAGVVHSLRVLSDTNAAQLGKRDFEIIVFSSWRGNAVAGLSARISEMLTRLKITPKSEPPSTFCELIEWGGSQIDGDLLIILDQFEEYFLYHGHEDGPGTFAVELPRAINRNNLCANFLISIREDALARLDFFKGRIPNLFNNYLRLEHLDQDAARAAIEKPLEVFNRAAPRELRMTIDPVLVDQVIHQLEEGKVSLASAGQGTIQQDDSKIRIQTPYLQLVMTRLWNEEIRTGSHVLQAATLNRLGGPERIVKTHLDEALNGFSKSEQDIVAQVFRFLVTPSGTKIAYAVSDLAEYTQLPKEKIEPVIEKLTGGDVRILRPVAPPPDQPQISRYEIFHDTLGAAIADWRTRYAEQRVREEERRVQQLARQKFMRRAAIVGAVVVLIVAGLIALTAYAVQEQQLAVVQESIAKSRELAAISSITLPSDNELATLLAIQAVEAYDTFEAENALRESLSASAFRFSLRGHTTDVLDAHYSPDGNLIVTASADNTARVWDANTGALLTILRGHTDWVNTAQFSPDSSKVVTTSPDKTARVWNAKTGNSLFVLSGHAKNVTNAIFSPDGKQILTGSTDNTGRLWDSATGKLIAVLEGHERNVNSIQFSSDSKLIVTSDDDLTARVWNATTGKQTALLEGHLSPVVSAQFSPDGSRVVTASRDNTARVWDSATGKLLFILSDHTGELTGAQFSPDGKHIITASRDNTARVWDSATGKSQGILFANAGRVIATGFSPDSQQIFTVQADNTIHLWDANKLKEINVLKGHTGSVYSAAYSPNGKQIVTASADSTAHVWNTFTGNSLNILKGHTNALYDVTFSANNDQILTASHDGTTRIWNAGTGDPIFVLNHNWGDAISAHFSPDGKQVVTVGRDNIAHVYGTTAGSELATLIGHTDIITSAQFSSDGKKIVTASRDATVRVWDPATGNSLNVLKTDSENLTTAQISPDGTQIVTGDENGLVQVWNLANGKSIAKMKDHTAGITSVQFSPDGTRLATTSRDKTIIIWDFQKHKALKVLEDQTDIILNAQFSLDGKKLVTTSADTTADVWDATTGELIAILTGHNNDVITAKFSPDGKKIVTAGADATAREYLVEVEDLLALAHSRVSRELNCDERQRYLHEEVCQLPTPVNTATWTPGARQSLVLPTKSPTTTSSPTSTETPTVTPTRTSTPTITPIPFTATPVIAPGVYVMQIRVLPLRPAPNQDISFFITFLNTSGQELKARWRIEIFRNGEARRFGERDGAGTIPIGVSELSTIDPYRVGNDGACSNFQARVAINDQGNSIPFKQPNGADYVSDFQVCP